MTHRHHRRGHAKPVVSLAFPTTGHGARICVECVKRPFMANRNSYVAVGHVHRDFYRLAYD
jgi:hypothetical protein